MKSTKEKSDEKVKALLDRAADGVREFLDGDKYKAYLRIMSQFHQYSARNCLLILMERPDATLVAGYSAWQKKFNRQVQRGEKGIQIVGYSTRTVKEEKERRDQNGNFVYDENGEVVVDVHVHKIPKFVPMYVWDVKQTDGEPLPSLATKLEQTVDNYKILLNAIKDSSDFEFAFEDIPNGANGYCNHEEKRIVIQQGMPEAQTVKTAVHELAHSIMHDGTASTDRHTKEVQAESVAFVVCEHYSIDTSDYTFPYLASWSKTAELKELQDSLDAIQKAANELITKIDKRFSELQELSREEPVHELNDSQNKQVKKELPATFTIYQLKPEKGEYLFRSYTETPEILAENYAPIWTDVYPPDWSLESIYTKFNIDLPKDFPGHSLSVSDVVVIQRGDNMTAHFVDTIGYKNLPDFARFLQQAKKLEDALREEMLDTIRYDGEPDFDKEPARPTIQNRIAAAQAEADRRNRERAELKKQQQVLQKS